MNTTPGQLYRYIFVPQETSNLVASGEVWTNSSFDTIGPGSYFLLQGVSGAQVKFRVDLTTASFQINPSAKLFPSPYLTKFVLGGFAQGNGTVELMPMQRTDGPAKVAVQGWNYSPPNDPGSTFQAASGNGVWNLQPSTLSPPSGLSVTLVA